MLILRDIGSVTPVCAVTLFMICGSLRTYIGSTPSFRCILFVLIVGYYVFHLISNIGSL